VPLQASELLGRTFSLCRSDLRRLAGVNVLPYTFVVVLVVVALVGAAALSGKSLDATRFGPLTATLLGVGGGLCLSVALLFLAAAAGTFMVVEERLRGESVALNSVGALLGGLGHLWRLALAYVGVGVGVGVGVAPAIAVTGAAVGLESWSLGGAAVLLWGLGAMASIYVGLRLVVVGPALVFENLGAWQALQRSADLTRGRLADVFVACAVLFATVCGMNMATSVLGLVPIFGLVVQVVVGVAVATLQSVFFALLYAALRDREARGSTEPLRGAVES
jgi:hypothetical protein